MKDIWKYIALFLTLVILGGSLVTMHNHSKLQDKIIELQEQAPIVVEKYVHDTIQFDSVQIKWRTKHDTAKYVIVDTFYHDTTITIVKEKIMHLDSFSVNERYQDSTIDATVNIQGRGIYENTYIDSISLDYTIKQIEKKRKCSWWRKIFCGCD